MYLDGGVRHGTDVLKALALGATAVFVGRPVLWGLACKVCCFCQLCWSSGMSELVFHFREKREFMEC